MVIDGRIVTVGGDVIIGVDGLVVRRLTDIVVYIERNKVPGDTVELLIDRNGQQLNLTLTIGQRPLP
jgi:S1-C subfamily serine protease